MTNWPSSYQFHINSFLVWIESDSQNTELSITLNIEFDNNIERVYCKYERQGWTLDLAEKILYDYCFNNYIHYLL